VNAEETEETDSGKEERYKRIREKEKASGHRAGLVVVPGIKLCMQ
jgi:hypothetical protein